MPAPTPEISVVIATHNRRDKLRRCLDSLALQTEPPDRFEVIVASDGSEDGTEDLLDSMRAPFALRLLNLEKAGKAAALNTGIESARGAICVFLDDDVVADPGLLGAHRAAHCEDPTTLGIGRLVQPDPAGRDWFGVAHAAAWNERYDSLALRRLDWPDTYGGNFSAPRQTLLEVGGFATDLEAIEDIELGYRLRGQGCVPRYLPAASGIHADEKPRGRLLGDMRRFGGFCAEFAERHPRTRQQLLGWFLETTPREVMLRRVLLALRVPTGPLAGLGRAMPGKGRKTVWVGFVSRYAFWLGARTAMGRRRWRQSTRGAPVLMYHAFGKGDEGDRYVLRVRRFARQLSLLRLLGYRTVTFGQLARMLAEGEAPPPRTAVLTIDDGYRDNLDLALPLLRRRRVAATLFLVSDRLGGVNDWTREGALARRPLLSDREACAMRDGGVEIGAHTRTHPSLPDVPPGDLDREVGGSREALERLLGQPIGTFAYPYGHFDARVAAACERAEMAACTVESRPARLGDNPLLIPRIEIRGGDSTLRFLRKLWFGGV